METHRLSHRHILPVSSICFPSPCHSNYFTYFTENGTLNKRILITTTDDEIIRHPEIKNRHR